MLLFTHENPGSGKATILTNILLGLIVNGKRVCVVNVDEDGKIFRYLGLESHDKKLVYSYVSECIVTDLLEVSKNREEQFIQWFGMYYPKFDYMIVNCSKNNEEWIQIQLGTILEFNHIYITKQIDEISQLKYHQKFFSEPLLIIYNGEEIVEKSEKYLKFPRLAEIMEGTKAGRPYIYFNNEDEKADVLWEFFDAFVEKI